MIKNSMKVLKTYSTPILLFLLVLTLSGLSLYNYYTQKNLLLEQMESDADDLASSIVASIERFDHIKSTMNLKALVNEVSFGLEIFEFRYLEPDGVIHESMFKQEIGKLLQSESFQETMKGEKKLGKFFFETRDYVSVLAIYYPIYYNDEMVGIVDLAVDISEYDMVNETKQDFLLLRRQVDIMNLLKSIEGSVRNSIKVFEETDLYNFLHSYVEKANNILEISIVDKNGLVSISSDKRLIGKPMSSGPAKGSSVVIEINDQAFYRLLTEKYSFDGGNDGKLLLVIDASHYKENEANLFRTALITSGIAIFFALFIARGIYYSALERSREEQERLERLVKERTYEIELLSKTDALTGLWNRAYLDEMLLMEFKRARRYEHDISIILVDLDHFKMVNDTYGHIAGDDVLKEAAKRIQEGVRDTDFVGRYGGEEIVVILPESSLPTAIKVGESIRSKIAESPVISGESSIKITTSIGISHLDERHEDIQAMFGEADEALYEAKSSGRNNVKVYDAKESV